MAKPIKNDRFIVKEKSGNFSIGTFVLVDKETGVNYLYAASGYSGGLTVLLDAQGKPVVTPILDEE